MKAFVQDLFQEEDGSQTMVMILLLAIFASLALVFHKEVARWIALIFLETGI